MSEPPAKDAALAALRGFFAECEDIELALLVGSRAWGEGRADSDWDIAVQWRRAMHGLAALGETENLRGTLAGLLGVVPERIDLIDIPSARLTMRAVIAEEGVLLKGGGSLFWHHFLLRTWGDLDDFYWAQRHAA